jgi:RES domain
LPGMIPSMHSPSRPVFRVARRGRDPFDPSPCAIAGPDGTFGNRFDDPSGKRGVPEEQRFRMVYCGTQPACAFGETIARFRTSIKLIAELEAIEDDEPLNPELRGGVVPEDWRSGRWLGKTQFGPSLRFANLEDPRTAQILRSASRLAQYAVEAGLRDIDRSTLNGPSREFTQEAARYIYDQLDEHDVPIFAGLRYSSRLHREWECWAIFADRMVHSPGIPETIYADHPGLIEAARLLNLRIEVFGKLL